MFAEEGKKLFTPGPLGCSRTVKEAMLTDVGSRDTDFIETIRAIRSKLIDIAGGHITAGVQNSLPDLGLNSDRRAHLSTRLLAAGSSSHLIVCNLLYTHVLTAAYFQSCSG
uniref:Uncharacterized protein n=1 Tax=Timema poppense TaxID=170557 RepID=A0A7R9DH15_TIMPO|nr:unnamed protein product [Timema poppensis]